MLTDERDIQYWVTHLSPRLGLGLHEGRIFAVVPFTMPPALSDIDRRLQEAHVVHARSQGSEVAEAQEDLFHATTMAVQEQLGTHSEAMAQLDDDELNVALGNARSLARDALACLHTELRRQEEEIQKEERIKEEWRRRDNYVQSQAFECRGPKKGRNRTGRQLKVPGKQELKQRCSRAVAHVEQRFRVYEHSVTAIAKLQEAGCIRSLAGPDEAALMAKSARTVTCHISSAAHRRMSSSLMLDRR